MAETIQFILAMIAYAIRERMARRIDYLQEEVRVLKEALATARFACPEGIEFHGATAILHHPRLESTVAGGNVARIIPKKKARNVDESFNIDLTRFSTATVRHSQVMSRSRRIPYLDEAGAAMRGYKGNSLSYGMTEAGIMVQVQISKPSAREWDDMVEAIRSESDRMLGIVILAAGGGDGPTGAQRQSVVKVAANYPSTFRGVVILTSSILIRAGMTAISWLIPGGIKTMVFGPDDLDRGLLALNLDSRQSQEVRRLVAELYPERKIAV